MRNGPERRLLQTVLPVKSEITVVIDLSVVPQCVIGALPYYEGDLKRTRIIAPLSQTILDGKSSLGARPSTLTVLVFYPAD